MKKTFPLFVFVLCINLISFSQSREIIWSDEFNYEGLPDNTKWGYDVGGDGWGNNELQYYTENRLENARVENGNLIIEAHYEDFEGRDYTSARLITKNKGDWKYGWFEMRAKLPSGRGTWPAFWMLPTDWEYGGWPDSGEIDIMEHVGYDTSKVHGTVHTKAYNHTNNTQKGAYMTKPDFESAFHIYSCEWTEYYIRMYIDYIHYFTFDRESGFEKWPFNKNFHILLNIAVGGSWGGLQGIDNSAFPTQYIIDYVRVFAPGTKPTGIIDNKLNDKIKVYPNPTGAYFYVDLSELESYTDCEVSIYNSMGKMVLHEKIEDNIQVAKLDISGNPATTYFYLVKSNHKILKRGGFVKQ